MGAVLSIYFSRFNLYGDDSEYGDIASSSSSGSNEIGKGYEVDGADVKLVDGDDNKEEGKKKWSEPSYTLVYPEQEEEMLKEMKKHAKKVEDQSIEEQVLLAAEEKFARDPSNANRMLVQKARNNMNKKNQLAKHQEGYLLMERRKAHLEWIEKHKIRQAVKVKEIICDRGWIFEEGLQKVLKGAEYVHCPNQFCALPFEKVPLEAGANIPTVRREDGRALHQRHNKHYVENRFRCRQCDTDFCAKCKSMPYHVGKTCDEVGQTAVYCRFCKAEIPLTEEEKLKEIKGPVCTDPVCVGYADRACKGVRDCGHICGMTSKSACQCFDVDCAKEGAQTSDDFCCICWTEGLGRAPCIVSRKCGHIFHRHCMVERLGHRWPGARITFAFLECPLCNVAFETDDGEVMQLMRHSKELQADIKMKARHFLKVEKLDDSPAITSPGGKFYNNPDAYAVHLFNFYMCHKCSQPYYGGKRNCEANQDGLIDFDPKELVCGGCSGGASCATHGSKHMHYKCRFCCSTASWFCFGMVHYCETCHSDPYRYWSGNNTLQRMPPQCEGKEKCPLGIEHPPNGFEEFLLGCSMCQLESLTGTKMEMNTITNDDDDYYDY